MSDNLAGDDAVRVRRCIVHCPEGTVDASIHGGGCTLTSNAPAVTTMAQAFAMAEILLGGDVPVGWIRNPEGDMKGQT